MEKQLGSFVADLQKLYAGNLVTIILHGSAVRSDYVPRQSDINLLIILKLITLAEIHSAEKAIAQLRRHLRVSPAFWTEEEFRNSSDVFPIEFREIRKSYKILFGQDLMQGISEDSKNLRHQLEFELRSKLLNLRLSWLEVRGNAARLGELLVRAGTSFWYLSRYVYELRGEDGNGELPVAIRRCRQLKQKEIDLNVGELEQLYSGLHESVEELVQKIDKI